MFRYLAVIGVISLIAIFTLVIYSARPVNRQLLVWLFLICIILMIVFDSYLTGLPIVLYNNNAILTFKIGTIPIEDFGYLIITILVCPALFEKFNDAKKH